MNILEDIVPKAQRAIARMLSAAPFFPITIESEYATSVLVELTSSGNFSHSERFEDYV